MTREKFFSLKDSMQKSVSDFTSGNRFHLLPLSEYLVLAVMITCYGITLSWFSLVRFWSFYSLNDLAIFEQSLWMTLQGHFFYSSLLTMSQFGLHNSPILFFILPVYALFQNTEVLLILQSFIYGLGAIPVYLIAREKLKGGLGLFFSGLYLL